MGGQFKDLVKPEVGRGGEPNFGMLENGQYPNPMSAEQAQALDRLSADPQVGLSQDTRDAIRDISRCSSKTTRSPWAGGTALPPSPDPKRPTGARSAAASLRQHNKAAGELSL